MPHLRSRHPVPWIADVLVADDTDHVISPSHRRVEHRGDAQGPQISFGELVGLRIGLGVIGGDEQPLRQCVEVARVAGRLEIDPGGVTVRALLVEVPALQ